MLSQLLKTSKRNFSNIQASISLMEGLRILKLSAFQWCSDLVCWSTIHIGVIKKFLAPKTFTHSWKLNAELAVKQLSGFHYQRNVASKLIRTEPSGLRRPVADPIKFWKAAGGRQWISPVVIYRKCTQRTSCLHALYAYTGKCGLLKKILS